jgi:glutaminyl-tRNA synthetase
MRILDDAGLATGSFLLVLYPLAHSPTAHYLLPLPPSLIHSLPHGTMSSDPSTTSTSLDARELPSMVNSPQLLAEHKRLNGNVTRTRFPPEPNGYLHVGHCKSMNMNFSLAFEKLGVPAENRETYFRYDDTNPEAESNEYIDSIADDVQWCGWKPTKTTYSSDYFHELHAFAIQLIKADKAYVCHQTKPEIEACREIAKVKVANPGVETPGTAESPWRNRPVEESLEEFENMRKGKYASGKAVLRMKIDMNHVNPNM